MTKKDLFTTYIEKTQPDKSLAVLMHMENPAPFTFRVNTIIDKEKNSLVSLYDKGFEIQRGPLENSYISDLSLSKTEEFETGKIYLQSLSSMLPAVALAPKIGEKVLDLCASPGSKTIQVADLMQNQGEIVAVENNRSRFFRLTQNLAKNGVKIAKVFNIDGGRFLESYQTYVNYFDKVLVDAPCSNEGNICFCDNSVEKWNPKLAKKISKLQRRLLLVGIRALKSGGKLVYSTCTYNRVENEEVVRWVLAKNPDLKIIDEQRRFYDGVFTGFYYALISKN